MNSKNEEVISIENVYEEELYYDNNFLVVIHQINLNENYLLLNSISLQFKSDNNKNILILEDLNFKPDKDIVVFSNLEINYKKTKISEIRELINQNEVSGEEINICKILSTTDKLKYFLKYVNSEELRKKLGQHIAEQFLIYSKNKEVFYSDVIEVFNLSFKTKKITQFLDYYEGFEYKFNSKIENDEFFKILNLYKSNKDVFFEKNISFFKEKIKKNDKKGDAVITKYKNALENFITFYQLFYDESYNIDKCFFNYKEYNIQ